MNLFINPRTVHQSTNINVQRFGDFFEVLQADILFASFDLADVGPVQVGYGTKPLLRETLPFTNYSYVRANAFTNAAHEAIIDHIGQLIHEIISSNLRFMIYDLRFSICDLSAAGGLPIFDLLRLRMAGSSRFVVSNFLFLRGPRHLLFMIYY